MRRGVVLFLVGSAVTLTLAGCGRWAFEQREPWRREAELACMRAGAVKPSATVVPIRAIDGPGICGADHPFKVAALGAGSALGYGDELRPPAAIGRGFPIPAPRGVAPVSMHAPVLAADRGPMSIHSPAADPHEEDDPDAPEPVDPAEPAGPSAQGSYGRSDGYPAAPFGRGRAYPGDPPVAPNPYRGQALAFADNAAAVTPTATLACPLLANLDQWMASSVQPAAQRWFGQPVAEIKQISAYSCRGMNGNPRARISEHAFGNALDIAAFTLADGRRVTVKDGWRGAPEEQGFLRDVHAAACEQFSTVLAPGSNRFHYDHIHVDLARRRSGRRVCNPQAVPGDLIARRAADRLATGALGGGRLGFAPEDAPVAEPRLPRAVPGED